MNDERKQEATFGDKKGNMMQRSTTGEEIF